MAFEVAADYDRFMGRYSVPLAVRFADWAGVHPGQRVLDVGCGPGALTARLVELVGAENVSAVDPSDPFVAAVRERHPAVEVAKGTAERLPHRDGTFDAALAQLVVHFMTDPVAGLREMGRVTRGGRPGRSLCLGPGRRRRAAQPLLACRPRRRPQRSRRVAATRCARGRPRTAVS